MAHEETITAQLLIGDRHPEQAGIIPSHYLFLSENHNYFWILVSENYSDGKNPKSFKVKWDTSEENMLKDAMLMIGLYVIKDKELLNNVHGVDPELLKIAKDMKWPKGEFDDSRINPARRKELYEKCRSIKNWPRMILSIFGATAFAVHLDELKNCPGMIEICMKH